MSLPPHPSTAPFLAAQPPVGIASSSGSQADWTSAPPPPALGATQEGRGDRDPVLFTHPRPNFILKPPDGSPLTRQAIQYDLLSAVFGNDQKVFTPPPELEAGVLGAPRGSRVSFGELYTTSLACSSKGTKSMKDKIYADPVFARAMAMMSLLVNIGRVNTTLAFYPEMRTILRTYHAIPCLQKSEAAKKHLQDAPRMKAALKGVVLDAERLNVPFTIAEVEKKTAEGARPPTSIANLIFTFITSSPQLSQSHFPSDIEPLDLFLPTQGIPSAQRARAFLWLVWHYYERPSSPGTENPFADDYSRAHPGQVPRLDRGVVQEGQENVDEREEIAFGEDMQLDRLSHLDVLQREADEIKRQVASGERAPTTKKGMGRKRKLAGQPSPIGGRGPSAIGSYTNSNAPSPAGSSMSLPWGPPGHQNEYDELDDELDALTGGVGPSPSRPGGVNFGLSENIGAGPSGGPTDSPSSSLPVSRREMMDFSDDEDDVSSSRGPAYDPPRYDHRMDLDPNRGQVPMSNAADEEQDEIESSSEEEVPVDEPPLVRPIWNAKPPRPPREKDFVRIAYARALATKDDILADSDLDSDSADEEAARDIRRKLSTIRAVQLSALSLPSKAAPSSSATSKPASSRPKKEKERRTSTTTTAPAPISEDVATVPQKDAAPPSTTNGGGGPKIKLNFGGRKTSLSSLLN